MAEPDRGSEPGFRDYAGMLWRRKVTIVVAMVLAVVVAVAFDVNKAPTYAASARLLFTAQGTALNPATTQQGSGAVNVPTDIQLVTSSPVVREVKKELGTKTAPTVTVAAITGTKVATVVANAATPQRAAKVANAYANAFIKVTHAQYINQQTQTTKLLDQQIASIQAKNQFLESELATTPPTSTQADSLNSQISANNDQLLSLQSSLNDAEEAMAKASGSGVVLQKATPDSSPVSPKPSRDAGLAAVVGLVIGIGLALLQEFLDDRIRTRADLERALGGVPAIGLIPTVTDWRDRKVPYLVAKDRPKSPAAEAYRGLRTALQFMAMDHPIRLIQVTSPAAADGKTTTSANLAVTMAQAGQRVILVSCDLRRPRIHEFFGVENEQGFTTVLVGECSLEDAIVPVPDIERLSMLPSGPVPPNPSELLSSPRARELFEAMGDLCDVVIIDSPPVLPVTDAAVLAASSDAVLLVAAAEVSARRDISRALELLDRIGALIVGAVLNRATEADSYVYYRYGYQYGYGYSYAGREANGQADRAGRGAPGGNGNGNGRVRRGAVPSIPPNLDDH